MRKNPWEYPSNVKPGEDIDVEYLRALTATPSKSPSDDMGVLAAWNEIHPTTTSEKLPTTNNLPFDVSSQYFPPDCSPETGREFHNENGNVTWISEVDIDETPQQNETSIFPLYYDIDPTSVMSMDVADFTFTPSCETFLDFIDETEEVYPDDKTILCSNFMKDINVLDVIWPKKQYNGDLYEYYMSIMEMLLHT